MKKWQDRLGVVALVLSFLSVIGGVLHFYKVRSIYGAALVPFKLVYDALAPLMAGAGVLGSLLGYFSRSPIVTSAGILGGCLSGYYLLGIWAPRKTTFAGSPERVGEIDASADVPAVPRRPLLRWLHSPKPRLNQNVTFGTAAGSDRPLFCDLWRPPEDVSPSGIAIIFFHLSAWFFLDKDMGTRAMFRHLASQGHVVMDVSYRLCPETNWLGMNADARRAVAWMKANAARYGADPARVVLTGGSAGGHLALMTGYAPQVPELTPDDLRDVDLSVRAMIAWYSPSDLRLCYSYQQSRFYKRIAEVDQWVRWLPDFGARLWHDLKFSAGWNAQQTLMDAFMGNVIGGPPSEFPEVYRLFSPVEYVGPHCPPTLLLHGDHDVLVSSEEMRALARKLREVGVPFIQVEYPWTEHGFDLIFPQVSPVAQASLYEVDKFLALI